MAVGTRCADHVTPLYQQKLALTSPTGGGRSVGIVHVRTKATEFSLVVLYIHQLLPKYVYYRPKIILNKENKHDTIKIQ